MQDNEIVFYQPNDAIDLEVGLERETVWLNRNQTAVLFGRDVKAIGLSQGILPLLAYSHSSGHAVHGNMLSRHHALSGYGALARGTCLQYPAQRSGRHSPAHSHECTMAPVRLYVGAADSRFHFHAGSLLLSIFATATMAF